MADPLREPLRSLRNEAIAILSRIRLLPPEAIDTCGRANIRCLQRRIDEAEAALAAPPVEQPTLCSDCPPIGYPTDKTRCEECPRAEQPSSMSRHCSVCGTQCTPTDHNGFRVWCPKHGHVDAKEARDYCETDETAHFLRSEDIDARTGTADDRILHETIDAMRKWLAGSGYYAARKANVAGDDLCWVTDPEKAKALPEAEFLESCRRYRNQIASERGEFTGGRTIAQLEAALAEGLAREKANGEFMRKQDDVIAKLRGEIRALEIRRP